MGSHIIGEWLTLSIMAVALGMDAFSVSLGLGMAYFRLKKIFFIGILIGLFHVIMPSIGMVLGLFFSAKLGNIAAIIGGVLLIILGIQMFLSSFSEEREIKLSSRISILLFALTVSLDSFSVGLSLGMTGSHTVIALFLFGVITTILTWVGFILARKVSHLFGSYSEMLGGSVLFAFGLQLVFS
ncbi:manganese efflux pump MntP [Salirhabdus salicampi]|uniref:manganese efflux pump MntP n=1 Tax=Salirhabdus salicampi TaxID=476102 RepID=UPI0020C3F7D2|nr:manganese efflux pump MntP family protein [Salirhabdus salicampi]MCP8617424.1 manganese efflux pump MntP family protein [Salirhabdus salicampi]